jgi:hypothetical protein
VHRAALHHVAVQRVAVDRVVDEIAVAVVQRNLPELGDWRKILEIERQRVAVRAGQELSVGILQANAPVCEREGVGASSAM